MSRILFTTVLLFVCGFLSSGTKMPQPEKITEAKSTLPYIETRDTKGDMIKLSINCHEKDIAGKSVKIIEQQQTMIDQLSN